MQNVSDIPERPRPPVGDIIREGTRPVKGPTIALSTIPESPPEQVKRNRYGDISDSEIQKSKNSWWYRLIHGIPKPTKKNLND